MQYSKETDHWALDIETDWHSFGLGLRFRWHETYGYTYINIGLIEVTLIYFTKSHIDVPDDILEDC